MADLWGALLAAETADEELTDEQRILAREFEQAGIASQNALHSARTRSVRAPWLSSFQHELVYATAARVAEATGVRVLFIKGPPLHAQGLRKREHSGDVDLWVDPDRVGVFCHAMGEWDWVTRSNFLASFPGLFHSHTLRPAVWGCEIDTHVRYPGVTRPPSEAFETLWEASETMEFAGVPARVPSRAAHAVIQALTLVRPSPGRTIAIAVREAAIEVLRTGGSDSLRFAERLGATGALSSELRSAFPEAAIPDSPSPPEWSWLAQPNPARVYLGMLRTIPWQQRPKLLWLILTRRHNEHLADQKSGTGASDNTESTLSRWRRGLSQLVNGNRVGQ